MFEDKYSFTQDQNRRFAKMNLTRLVFTNSRFEGVNTTLSQTQTIIDGLGVDGVPIDDINIIVQLKRAWQYIINEDRPVSLRVMKNINSVVAKMDSLVPGELRNGSGFVATLRGDFVPPDVDEQAEEKYLQELLENKDKSATEKSIELMYHLMRNQIFWDGNKRTATLIANKYMIDAKQSVAVYNAVSALRGSENKDYSGDGYLGSINTNGVDDFSEGKNTQYQSWFLVPNSSTVSYVFSAADPAWGNGAPDGSGFMGFYHQNLGGIPLPIKSTPPTPPTIHYHHTNVALGLEINLIS